MNVYEVTISNAETGQDRTVTVEAYRQREAAKLAKTDGWMVGRPVLTHTDGNETTHKQLGGLATVMSAISLLVFFWLPVSLVLSLYGRPLHEGVD